MIDRDDIIEGVGLSVKLLAGAVVIGAAIGLFLGTALRTLMFFGIDILTQGL